jgi:hypothetical protein
MIYIMVTEVYFSILYLLIFIRDFWAKVVAVDGVNILTTPTETSVSKERLEKDKVHMIHLIS